MSDQNNGDQWNKGYEPPAGSMADEQRRAAEDAQRQQERQWQQQQAEDFRRSEEANRAREANNNRSRNTHKKQKKSNQSSGTKTRQSRKKVGKKESFSYGWATIGFIAIGMYAYTTAGLGGWPALIVGFVGGIICGYAYKLIIVIAIIGGIYYYYNRDIEEDKSSLTNKSSIVNVNNIPANSATPAKRILPAKPIPLPPKPAAPSPTFTASEATFDIWKDVERQQREAATTVESSLLYAQATSSLASSFKKIEISHQVTQNGKIGMLVTSTFAVRNLRNLQADLYVNLYQKNGLGIKTYDYALTNPLTKQLSFPKRITPLYDDTIYKDFKTFIPYASITLPKEKNTAFTLNLTVQHRNFRWGNGSEHYSLIWN